MRVASRFVPMAVVLLMLGAGATVHAQTYVGDQTCKICHANFPTAGFFDGYMRSGHPWKLFNNAGATPAPDTWPFSPVPPLPVVHGAQLAWTDVEYVIGNYFWKARFVDRNGYIHTGDVGEATQWNLATQEWVPYHAGDVDKPYNCGRCHTTGYDPNGNQNGLPGLIGTWAQDGVRCEACHGPGSDHVASPTTTPPPGGKDCSECHYRDSQFRMPWSGGFMRHHQQAEDLSHSPHSFLPCTTCHNPHRSTVYNDGGSIADCSMCHPGDASNNFYVVRGMESVTCTDCHMPFMGKSAVAVNAHKADIRGHLFRIMTAPVAAADNTHLEGTTTFWNQDPDGKAWITLDYACLGCHEEIGSPMSLEQAAAFAAGIHSPTVPVAVENLQAVETADGVRLTWRLAATSLQDALEIRVQRAPDARGPFAELTPQGLEPRASMQFDDAEVQPGEAWYRLAIAERDGSTTFAGPVHVAYTGLLLQTALQEPIWTQDGVKLRYSIATPADVRIEIFDVAGRLVRSLREGRRDHGRYVAHWDALGKHGKPVARGTYLVRLQAGRDTAVSKLVLVHR